MIQMPLVFFLNEVIQLPVHLGYTDFAENTDIIVLKSFIAAFPAFFCFHADSPPFPKTAFKSLHQSQGF